MNPSTDKTNPLLVALLVTGTSLGAFFACSPPAEQSPVTDKPPDGLKWTDGTPSFLTEATRADPYVGDDPTTLEAQDRLPTGSSLHGEVVLRSCGPLGGVCHNQKEYPDLHTPANFLATIGAPCNVQSGTPESIFDRCERPGDRFILADGSEKEIGWVEVVPDEREEDEELKISEAMPGLHLHLAEPVTVPEDNRDLTGQFIRTFVHEGKVQDLSYAKYESTWHSFDGGMHIVAEVRDNRIDEITALLSVGIEQGDLNKNGIFGARPDENNVTRGPVPLLDPGNPETSYLVARMRGHMQGEKIPGSRMPLANAPFSVAEMLALFCFIEQLPEDGQVNLASDIDYKNCSYSDPERQAGLAIEGAGTNWSDRISPLIESNCGGCHSEERASGDLVLVGDDVFEFLTQTTSSNDPKGRKFIEPGDPRASYLFLKLIDDPSIQGAPMPVDPIQGVRTLSEQELLDIETWITNGAAP